MDYKVFPRVASHTFIKRQPSYCLLFFDYLGSRHSLGMNETAETILELCTGNKSVDELIVELANCYHDSEQSIEDKVLPFLKLLASAGIVSFERTPEYSPVVSVGSRDVVTVEQVLLELTYNCPLKCRHCFVEAGQGPTMERDVLIDVLENKLFPTGLRAAQLTGGEPFAYSGLDEIVNLFAKRRIPVQVTTSGYLLDEQARAVVSALSRSAGSIQVSVDGTSNYHDHLRGIDGSFNRALQFIDYAIKKKVRVVSATTLIDQRREDIHELCALMRDMGVSMFRLGALSSQGRASNLGGPVLWSVEQVRLLIDELANCYNTQTFSIGWIEDPGSDRDLINCGAGTKMLVINPRFYVRPCPMISDCLGNIKDESLGTIMKRGNRLYLDLHSPCDRICGSCPEVDNCRGCMASGLENAHKSECCSWLQNEYDGRGQ